MPASSVAGLRCSTWNTRHIVVGSVQFRRTQLPSSLER